MESISHNCGLHNELRAKYETNETLTQQGRRKWVNQSSVKDFAKNLILKSVMKNCDDDPCPHLQWPDTAALEYNRKLMGHWDWLKNQNNNILIQFSNCEMVSNSTRYPYNVMDHQVWGNTHNKRECWEKYSDWPLQTTISVWCVTWPAVSMLHASEQ